MDWMQFVASLVQSVAWPAVLVVLLFILRKQLVSVASRIEEMTFPGGSVKLSKAVLELAENAVLESKGLESKSEATQIDHSSESDSVVDDLYEYKKLERQVYEAGWILDDKKTSRNSTEIVQQLNRKKFITDSDEKQFISLREVRNELVQGTYAGHFVRSIFRDQTKKLQDTFGALLKNYSDEIMKHKQEAGKS